MDISARLAAADDGEVMRLYAAMRMTRDIKRYAEIAATFPQSPETIEEWRDQWATFDYGPVLRWRAEIIALVRKENLSSDAIKAWYRDGRYKEFTEHWGTTYDPRNATNANKSDKMPMLLFPRQRDFLDFLYECLIEAVHGQAEKVRDFGATWLGIFFSVWLWATESGASIGWGSRKEELVDRIGDFDSIFEKARFAIRQLPFFLLPQGFADQDNLTFMKAVNPETGATITGECGDNIGRGGRKLLYFKDESAHYARPELIEAALGDNTRVQIDISTPNGLGNVFHRRRKAGKLWIKGAKLRHDRANVFVMDWHDHPAKDQAWYDERKDKAIREGLLHKFKQEVDRDYAASVEGIIIHPEWVQSAIDAHLKLGLDDSGGWSAGLDVGDNFEGDGNAWTAMKGIVIRHADAWGDIDGGAATRRMIQNTEEAGIRDVDTQYDCIGVGATVKAEANRLNDTIGEDGLPLMPDGIRLIPWNAASGVLNPDDHVIPEDRESPTNKDMFANFKAQAWWMIARRFEKTHRAIHEGIHYEPHELISIDSRIPMLQQLVEELSQPVAKKRPSDMKLLVDKTPEGTRSPNMGDSTIMCAFPAQPLAPVFRTAIPEFLIPPFAIPVIWPRGYALRIEPGRTLALWAAHDIHQRTLYITAEHLRSGADASTNVAAIIVRGEWMPGIIDSDETKLEARRELAQFYAALGLEVTLADRAFEAGISDVNGLISTGRLKVFSSCQRTISDYRAYRRDAEGELSRDGGLMECLRILCRPSSIVNMRLKPKYEIVKQPLHAGQGAHRGDLKAGY